MAGLDSITVEDWEYLQRTLEAAMHAVMIAHTGGDAQEKLAKSKGWADAPGLFPRNDFVMDLFHAMPDEVRALNEQKSPHLSGNVEATIADAVEMCGRSTALIRSKIPEELEPFRQIVLFLATKVARASKEGGFMGIGGQLVSAEEKAVIDRLVAVLPPEPRS